MGKVGEPALGIKLRRAGVDKLSEELGPEHTHVGTYCSNLGSPLQAKGDLAGAEPLLRRGKSEVARPAAERPRGGPSGRRQRAPGRPGRALERPGGGPLPELATTPFSFAVHSPVATAPRGNKGLH